VISCAGDLQPWRVYSSRTTMIGVVIAVGIGIMVSASSSDTEEDLEADRA
jgi:hypothetical protein